VRLRSASRPSRSGRSSVAAVCHGLAPPASAVTSALERQAEIEAALTGGGDPCALGMERARTLDSLGMTAAAREAFLGVLAREGAPADALNELGCLLDRTGHHIAARSAFERAVALHPNDPIGHGNLAIALLDDGDDAGAQTHLETAIRLDPHNVPAHQCLAILYLRRGDAGRAARYGRVGFRAGASVWPYRGGADAIPVLVLNSALGGNVSTEYFIDDTIFEKWTLVAEFADPQVALPPHALVFNAVGDADRCAAALDAARAIIARTAAPVINAPAAVEATSRYANAQRLAGVPGVVAPTVGRRTRRQISPRRGSHFRSSSARLVFTPACIAGSSTRRPLSREPRPNSRATICSSSRSRTCAGPTAGCASIA
jgi:tetratricopeptide (TPR) repeat protein